MAAPPEQAEIRKTEERQGDELPSRGLIIKKTLLVKVVREAGPIAGCGLISVVYWPK